VNLGGTLFLRGYPLYGYIIGSRAWMGNAELRYPLLDYFTLGTPVGPFRFPEVQGAFFADVGRAWLTADEHRAVIGSYGVSFRMPVIPGFVLRVDWGRRFSDGDYRGYGLSNRQKRRGFVQLFFGYNY
jgi:outer membrane protein assembly factor BamA